MIRRLCCMLLMFGLLLGTAPLLVQAQAPAFAIQVIAVNGMPAYDMKAAPGGTLAVVYMGPFARILAGVPILEYSVDPASVSIRILDLTTGTEIRQIVGAQDYVSDAAFSPDGSRLAIYYLNGDVYVWDTATWTLAHQFTALWGDYRVAFLPDNRSLVALNPTPPSVFLVWDTTTGIVTHIWRTRVPSFGVLKLTDAFGRLDTQYVAFDLAPDGTRLATATPNGEIRLWDTATLEQRIVRSPDEQPGLFNIRRLHFSADGTRLVYYDRASQATHIWDSATRIEQPSLALGGLSFALSPDSTRIAWVDEAGVHLAALAQPAASTLIPLTLPENVVLQYRGTPPLVFTSKTQLVIGGFVNNAGGDSVLAVVTLSE